MKNFEMSKSAEFVLARLNKAGFSAFLVGGSVRDFLMGKAPHDFDVTTSATPEEMLEIFSDTTTFKTGISHGTVGVHKDGENIEVTTFRADGEYLDHRHPEKVSFSRELADDLSRRDFTVNAMAYSENEGIVDLFRGREDIEKRIIRCVGNPERRFDEDALRILRALRFSSTLDFSIEEDTSKAVFLKKDLLTFVSRERIAEEVIKLLSGIGAPRVLRDYHEVFEVIFEGLSRDGLFESIERVGPEYRLAVFFAFSKDYERDIISMKLPKPLRNKLISVEKAFKNGIPDSEEEIKSLVSQIGKDISETLLSVTVAINGESEATKTLSRVLSSGEVISFSELEITGGDIVALGVPPSSDVGKLMREIYEEVLSGSLLNDKKAIIERLRHKISKKY